jgi:hypothetical protein
MCWSSHQAADLQNAISRGKNWKLATTGLCADTSSSCFHMTNSQASDGTIFDQYIQMQPDSAHPAVLLLTLSMQVRSFNTAPPASGQLTLDPTESQPDLDVSKMPVVSVINNGALAALPAPGLTYDNTQLGRIKRDCGQQTPAYSAKTVASMDSTSVLCTRAQNGRYAKIRVSYTSGQYIISWILWPAVF